MKNIAREYSGDVEGDDDIRKDDGYDRRKTIKKKGKWQ